MNPGFSRRVSYFFNSRNLLNPEEKILTNNNYDIGNSLTSANNYIESFLDSLIEHLVIFGNDREFWK